MSKPVTAERLHDPVAAAIDAARSNVEGRQDLGAVSAEEVGRFEKALLGLQRFWANQIFHPL